MPTVKLDPSAYDLDPEVQRVTGVLAEEIELLRDELRSTESPMPMGLLGVLGYQSDLRPWHELATSIDVLKRTADKLEISLDSLVESILKLKPVNWLVFFWMGQWLQVQEAQSGRERSLRLAFELQKMSLADAERAIADAKRDRLAASSLGGKARSQNSGSRSFKEWALEAAKTMRGSDTMIARALVKKLPKQFLEVSVDPERLIYDALRENRRSK